MRWAIAGIFLDTHPGNSLRMIVKQGTLAFPGEIAVGPVESCRGRLQRRGEYFQIVY